MAKYFSTRWKATAVSVIGVAVVAVWLAPSPRVSTAANVAPESWKLPEYNSTDVKKAIETVQSRSLWGIVAVAAPEGPTKDPEWRFVGTGGDGKDRYVMIQIEGQPVSTLKTGDQLPGGAKILRVDDDRLCLLVSGRKRVLDLNRK